MPPKYFKKKGLFRKKTPTTKTAKLSVPMKKAIKKVINGSIETKYAQDNASLSNVAFNSGINANADAYFLLNSLTQGTDSNNRIGDTISDVYMKVSGYVTITNPNTNSPTTARLYAVRLMLLRQKTLPLNVTNLSWTSLLKGNIAYNGFTGAGVNLFQPINRNDFEVFGDKIVHLSSAWSSTATQSFADLQHTSQMFSLTAKHKGKVKYAEGTNVPLWDPFFCLGYIYEDGSGTIDTVSTNVTVCGILEAYWKDA